jgi:hypothetical protein
MLQHEDAFSTIGYDQELDALTLQFKKQAPTQDFINLNKKAVEFFLKLNTNKFYVDTRKIGVVSLEGQKFVIDEVFPRMLAHTKGRKFYHVQVINPSEVFGKVAASNIKNKASLKRADEKLIIESFDCEIEAKAWLKKI